MCYLAVHNEVADAAGEVFVLKLRVDVGDVLVHTTKLEHVAHVQVSETYRSTNSHTVDTTHSAHGTGTGIAMSFGYKWQKYVKTKATRTVNTLELKKTLPHY